MNTIHINKEINNQYGEDIRHYLFMHTINDKNFLPAEIIRFAMDLYNNFYNDKYPVSDVYNATDGSCKKRIHYLLAEDTYFEKVGQIKLEYTYESLNALLGDFHVTPAKNIYPYYSYAQTVTTATYLLTLANRTLKATPKKLGNLADNCYRLLSYQKWMANTSLCKFAITAEYLRGKLCCGNIKEFTNSILNWFDYLEILEFRIMPHACNMALDKFRKDNLKSGLITSSSSNKDNSSARKMYQLLTQLLSNSYYKKYVKYPASTSPTAVISSNTVAEKKQRRSRLPVTEEGFLNNTTTMALWNLRKQFFPEAVVSELHTEKNDYNHPMDEEAYKKIVQRYRTILDENSLSAKEIITDTRIIIALRKNYIPSVSGSSANGVVQCAFCTTEEFDNLFVDFCSSSLNTVIKLLENETGTDYYDVIQLYYLIKNEIENICLDDTPSKPLYAKQLADIEDNYIQFIRTKLIQVLEERNIPDTRAFILDLSLFDTVNSLELAETLLSCDPVMVDNDLLVDCCQFICHSSTIPITKSFTSISNQVCCIAFSSDEIPKHAPLNRITSFRDYNDLDETEHEMINIYADMIYNDLTDIHRQIADIFINCPI